jgi:hypothetical protein
MNPNIRVTPMSPEHAVKEWTVIKSFFEKALPYACGRHNMDHVLQRIKDGFLMPLLVWDPEEKFIYAVLGAEGANYPLKKVFEVTLAGGENLQEWAHVYPAVKEIARSMGFDQIDVTGRRGWGKFIEGARDVATIFTEDLNDG